ncbi:hypothetical protein CASFOL_017181 [Castilleja foliolosa]|uniref:Uncharacterized protein n=1 Tax=Castilleja foliolosa TaxID=1961234 RepID=A0ABD3DDM1_9LAMI
MAHGSLCVTRAMQHELSHNWGIKATVLYDQPPEFFRPASLTEKHNGLAGAHNNNANTTPFTTLVGSDISLKQNRPALIVSSTSWTPDEDFGILLEAALLYDRRVSALLGEDDSKIADEVVWDEIHKGKQFTYPRGLSIASWVSRFRRVSAYFIIRVGSTNEGCGYVWLWATRLCGFIFLARLIDIKELVDVEKNGLLFSTSGELVYQLMMLFEGFPEKCDALRMMRSNLMERVSSVRWATAWDNHAKPLIYEVYCSKVQLNVQENDRYI